MHLSKELGKSITGIQTAEYYAAMKKNEADRCILT